MKKIYLGDLSTEIIDKAYDICTKVERASKSYDYKYFDLEDYDELFKPLLNYKIKAVKEFAKNYRETVRDALIFASQEDFDQFIIDTLDRFVEKAMLYTKEMFE